MLLRTLPFCVYSIFHSKFFAFNRLRTLSQNTGVAWVSSHSGSPRGIYAKGSPHKLALSLAEGSLPFPAPLYNLRRGKTNHAPGKLHSPAPHFQAPCSQANVARLRSALSGQRLLRAAAARSQTQ